MYQGRGNWDRSCSPYPQEKKWRRTQSAHAVKGVVTSVTKLQLLPNIRCCSCSPFPPLPPKKHVGYGALHGTIPPGASLEKTKAEFDAWEQTHAVLVQTVNSSMASNKTMLEHRSSAKFLGPFWILLDLMETCCLFPEAIGPTSKPACRTAEYAAFKQGYLEIFGNCPSSQPCCLQEIQVLNRDLKEQKKTADELANQLENRPSPSLRDQGLVFPVLCSVACVCLQMHCENFASHCFQDWCCGLAWFGQEMYQVSVEFRYVSFVAASGLQAAEYWGKSAWDLARRKILGRKEMIKVYSCHSWTFLDFDGFGSCKTYYKTKILQDRSTPWWWQGGCGQQVGDFTHYDPFPLALEYLLEFAL